MVDKDDSRKGDIRRSLLQRLQSLERAGVCQLPKIPPPSPARSEAAAPQQPPGVTNRPEVPAARGPSRSGGGAIREQPRTPTISDRTPTPPAKPRQAQDARSLLAELQREVVRCQRCEQLMRTRTQTVFGVGNPQARLCFLGEAPGADEDRRGEPFVGPAGQLLTKIIRACTLRREEVYILNVLKCRPPENRNPDPEEVANCRQFFERQLEIIQPEFICCLGAVAAQSLLRTTQSVGRLRGRFHDYRGAQVVVTYHPSYLLRRPQMKRPTWEDMKMLMKAMGLELPKR